MRYTHSRAPLAQFCFIYYHQSRKIIGGLLTTNSIVKFITAPIDRWYQFCLKFAVIFAIKYQISSFGPVHTYRVDTGHTRNCLMSPILKKMDVFVVNCNRGFVGCKKHKYFLFISFMSLPVCIRKRISFQSKQTGQNYCTYQHSTSTLCGLTPTLMC